MTNVDVKNWKRWGYEAMLLVNVESQKMHLIDKGQWQATYLISTAANGIGQVSRSYQTPLGMHAIDAVIGKGAEPYAIFKSKAATGAFAAPNDGTDAIIGRVLPLRGCEPAFNQGTNREGQVVDSYERAIYIHGTPELARLGTPASKGCIRLAPDDVIDLAERVCAGMPVWIYAGAPSVG